MATTTSGKTGLFAFDPARCNAMSDGVPKAMAAPWPVSSADTSMTMPFGEAADFQSGKPSFWVGEGAKASGPLHVAFVAPSRAAVDVFYHAAIEAGGADNGAPGLRPQYHATYYAAFVLDPDGNNIEAVCHSPE